MPPSARILPVSSVVWHVRGVSCAKALMNTFGCEGRTWSSIVQGAHKHDMMSFTNILQRDAEERGMMDIQDKELDDWVPEPVIKDYVVEVLQNCRQLVEEMDALRHVTRADGSRRRQTVLEEAHEELSNNIGNLSLAETAQ
eukprot:jgi/Ulvmu1/3137/UM015_0177.1